MMTAALLALVLAITQSGGSFFRWEKARDLPHTNEGRSDKVAVLIYGIVFAVVGGLYYLACQ
jgi:hypothetical protein